VKAEQWVVAPSLSGSVNVTSTCQVLRPIAPGSSGHRDPSANDCKSLSAAKDKALHGYRPGQLGLPTAQLRDHRRFASNLVFTKNDRDCTRPIESLPEFRIHWRAKDQCTQEAVASE
jgi:hypothetical protein